MHGHPHRPHLVHQVHHRVAPAGPLLQFAHARQVPAEVQCLAVHLQAEGMHGHVDAFLARLCRRGLVDEAGGGVISPEQAALMQGLVVDRKTAAKAYRREGLPPDDDIGEGRRLACGCTRPEFLVHI